MLSRVSRKCRERRKNKLMIDILLPAYDITQGDRLYDEILAAQFCIQLAENLYNSRVAPFYYWYFEMNENFILFDIHK